LIKQNPEAAQLIARREREREKAKQVDTQAEAEAAAVLQAAFGSNTGQRRARPLRKDPASDSTTSPSATQTRRLNK